MKMMMMIVIHNVCQLTDTMSLGACMASLIFPERPILSILVEWSTAHA